MMRAIVYAALVLATSVSAFAEPTANEQIVREYLAAVGQPGQAGLTEHLSGTVTFNGREIPAQALADFLSGFRQGFPDLEFVILGQIADGDRVATWGRFRGTHTGEFSGIPPTGKEVEWLGIAVDRIEDGKVVEMWHEMDFHGLLRQLKATAAE